MKTLIILILAFALVSCVHVGSKKASVDQPEQTGIKTMALRQAK